MLLEKLICKVGIPLCSLATLVAPMVSRGCRIRFYQPEEPEGLQEFIQAKKKL